MFYIVWIARVSGACVDSETLLSPWIPVAFAPTQFVADVISFRLNRQFNAAAGDYVGWIASVAPVGTAPRICH